MNRDKLCEKMREAGALWCYAPNAHITDKILTEAVLRYGDVPELKTLFLIFPKSDIRTVWCECVIPDERFYPHNYYLALIFFDIKNPRRYIERMKNKFSRYERIRKSLAENGGSIDETCRI
jgi:hypothetical protein